MRRTFPAHFTTPVRNLIRERSGGVCEGCHGAPATQVHHRQFITRGGKGAPSNAAHLCAGVVGGNVDGCHGKAHAGYHGEALGWAIRSNFDPLLVPFFTPGGWVLFDDDGGATAMDAGAAVSYLRSIGAVRDGLK